ncbi:MAG: glycosyltransferase WbuB [Bacteroidetes bacterium HGW-Bacteroidetes-21]|nr:MAG: glycosyltransferase WbuB [Bacteroidetes bacterium HGW-Bacteroidetes-21]
MKLIILTQYFPPEVGAPQNRLFELAVRLRKVGMDVTIMTAMPNYPQMKVHKGYRWRLHKKEVMEGMTVHRSWIYAGSSKRIIPRLFNYFSFVFSSMLVGLFVLRKSDFLMVESPPLFLGISARFLCRMKRAKMIFNVSDLWPESAEKLGLVTNRTMLNWAYKLERHCYKKSALITGQTQGICRDIQKRFPQKKVYWLKNGVDINFYDFKKQNSGAWRKEHAFSDNDFILFYGGILGFAQGLEVILKAASRLKEHTNIKFLILGSGPEKDKLITMKHDLHLDTVVFLDAVPKSQMQEIIASTNASIVPLKRNDLFKGAIPSKIFENLALKKPILLGVEGEAKELFIDTGKCGLFFTPENDEELAIQILELYRNPALVEEMGENGHKFASVNFNRDIIASELFEEIQKLKTK